LAINTLHYDDIDITGFAGIRERILIMDPRQFGMKTIEGTWQGIGRLVYLAHAFFRPHGETGKHFHDNIDIVSVMTRGSIFHKGTLGDGETVSENEVQVQWSGPEGFHHNEINPLDNISGMVQIWMQPCKETKASARHQTISITPGYTPIMHEGDTLLGIVMMTEKGSWQPTDSDQEQLIYVFDGDVTAICHDRQQAFPAPRGTLIKGNRFSLKHESPCQWLWVRECPLNDEPLS